MNEKYETTGYVVSFAFIEGRLQNILRNAVVCFVMFVCDFDGTVFGELLCLGI
jgi:hypothetical protein